jgi:hypothetical protein
MPRPRKKEDLFSQVRRQADRALALLNAEIRRTENELRRLLSQASLWRDAIGGSSSGGRRMAGPANGRRSGVARRGARRDAGAPGRRRAKRVSWDEVLRSVPEKFSVADVMKHPGARSKGRVQIYPALTRWQHGKKIKKIGKGKYQRL